MKIYLTKMDYSRLNCTMDEGRYSLKNEGEYTEAVRLNFIGNATNVESYGVFFSHEPFKVFILDMLARTFRQIDGWAPRNL
jgi:hypothetical protein